MAFDDATKERIRYHLGYMNVQVGSGLSFGLPIPIQTLFVVDFAMNRMIAAGEPRVIQILDVMDKIECRLIESTTRLAASSLGDLKLRDDEPDKLEREYCRWGMRLAGQLGCPIYAYSERYAKYSRGGNIPVQR